MASWPDSFNTTITARYGWMKRSWRSVRGPRTFEIDMGPGDIAVVYRATDRDLIVYTYDPASDEDTKVGLAMGSAAGVVLDQAGYVAAAVLIRPTAADVAAARRRWLETGMRGDLAVVGDWGVHLTRGARTDEEKA